MKITNKMVAQELDGLPKNKLHCSNLGADALHKAIEDYRSNGGKKKRIKMEPMAEPEADKECHCPVCDIEVPAESAFCGKCGTKLRFCSECGSVIPREAEECSECGAKLKPLSK